MDIALLIEQCRRNNAKGQQQLYELYFKRLFAVAYRYVDQFYIVEELIADAFIKIFKNINSFNYENDQMFYAWMKRIVINECLMYIRQQKTPTTSIEDSEYMESESNVSPLDTLSVKEIMRCIHALPDGYRTVFNLYHFENYTHQEISEILNISTATSKSQLHKAKKSLQQTLKTLYHEA